MDMILNQFFNVASLYVLIAAGYASGRFLSLDRRSVAQLVIYLFTPAVVFDGVRQAVWQPSSLALPIMMFACCCLLCMTALTLGGRIWGDGTRNLFGFAVGSGNTGYFGLPLVLSMLGLSALPMGVLAAFGFVLFENTVGYFVVARAKHSLRESIGKVLRLPAIYAFAAGVAMNGVAIGPDAEAVLIHCRGAYICLGLLLVGASMVGVSWRSETISFTGACLAGKFIVWPALVASCIALDATFTNWLNAEGRAVAMIMSAVPIAANTVAVSAQLGLLTEKASAAVVASTVLGVVITPIVVVLFC